MKTKEEKLELLVYAYLIAEKERNRLALKINTEVLEDEKRRGIELDIERCEKLLKEYNEEIAELMSIESVEEERPALPGTLVDTYFSAAKKIAEKEDRNEGETIKLSKEEKDDGKNVLMEPEKTEGDLEGKKETKK